MFEFISAMIFGCQVVSLQKTGFKVLKLLSSGHSEGAICSGLMTEKKKFTHMQFETTATEESLVQSGNDHQI
jgi:hypothetical protein